MASFRSAQSADFVVHVLVRVGIADSFHLVEHGQVQLAGGACGSFGGGAAHVDAARHAESVAKRPKGAAGGDAPGLPSRPPPEAARMSIE